MRGLQIVQVKAVCFVRDSIISSYFNLQEFIHQANRKNHTWVTPKHKHRHSHFRIRFRTLNSPSAFQKLKRHAELGETRWCDTILISSLTYETKFVCFVGCSPRGERARGSKKCSPFTNECQRIHDNVYVLFLYTLSRIGQRAWRPARHVNLFSTYIVNAARFASGPNLILSLLLLFFHAQKSQSTHAARSLRNSKIFKRIEGNHC